MSQLSVLIVDDCQDTTASLAFLVEAWGYAVRVANNAQEAVCLAAEHQPNVVILDVGLPDMNGWDLARQLRGLPGLRDTLLLAVSGFGGAEDQRRSLEAGCDRHLTKPVAPGILQGLLVTPKGAPASASRHQPSYFAGD